ncbi:MAG: carbohydrate-binding domain-containing protein [Coriobacteriales bacterium]|nr:carbohydrate-binding domain-containing protein [Coriobacteriales bacterium]
MKKKLLSIFLSFTLIASFSGLFSGTNFAWANNDWYIEFFGVNIVTSPTDVCDIDVSTFSAAPDGCSGRIEYDGCGNLKFTNLNLAPISSVSCSTYFFVNTEFAQDITVEFAGDNNNIMGDYIGQFMFVTGNINNTMTLTGEGTVNFQSMNYSAFTADNLVIESGIYNFNDVAEPIVGRNSVTIDGGQLFADGMTNFCQAVDGEDSGPVDINGGEITILNSEVSGFIASEINIKDNKGFTHLKFFPSFNGAHPFITDPLGTSYDNLNIDPNSIKIETGDSQDSLQKRQAYDGKSFVSLTPKTSLTHEIFVSSNPTEGGVVTSNKFEANAGELVTLSITPFDAYLLSTLDITDENDNIIRPTLGQLVGDYTFTMPDADVEVVGNFVTENYQISDGSKSIYNGANMQFRSNAPYEDFVRLDIDGAPVDSSNYTAESGSTLITVKSSFLDKLEVGDHDLAIISTDGYAATTFTIPDAEIAGGSTDTGDSTPYAPLGLVVLTLGVAGAVIVLRKRFN